MALVRFHGGTHDGEVGDTERYHGAKFVLFPLWRGAVADIEKYVRDRSLSVRNDRDELVEIGYRFDCIEPGVVAS